MSTQPAYPKQTPYRDRTKGRWGTEDKERTRFSSSSSSGSTSDDGFQQTPRLDEVGDRLDFVCRLSNVGVPSLGERDALEVQRFLFDVAEAAGGGAF
jgi:hypothetical protein